MERGWRGDRDDDDGDDDDDFAVCLEITAASTCEITNNSRRAQREPVKHMQ